MQHIRSSELCYNFFIKTFILLVTSILLTLGAWVGFIGSSFGIAYTMRSSIPSALLPILILITLAIFNPLTFFIYLYKASEQKNTIVRNILYSVTVPFALISWIVFDNAMYYRGAISYFQAVYLLGIGGCLAIIAIYIFIMILTSKKSH